MVNRAWQDREQGEWAWLGGGMQNVLEAVSHVLPCVHKTDLPMLYNAVRYVVRRLYNMF